VKQGRRSWFSSVPLGLVALGIGISIAFGILLAIDVLSDRALDLKEEYVVITFFFVWITLPFVLLAVLGLRVLTPWVVAIVTTLLLWTYILYDAFSNQGMGRGVNIGLGVIYLISPVIITTISVIFARRHLRRNGER